MTLAERIAKGPAPKPAPAPVSPWVRAALARRLPPKELAR